DADVAQRRAPGPCLTQRLAGEGQRLGEWAGHGRDQIRPEEGAILEVPVDLPVQRLLHRGERGAPAHEGDVSVEDAGEPLALAAEGQRLREVETLHPE